MDKDATVSTSDKFISQLVPLTPGIYNQGQLGTFFFRILP